MSGPSVAVIMPVFNGKAFLKEAIDSVLNQESADWHLYCVDDVSQDGSYELMSLINDSRITVSRQPQNCGLYGVLNEWVRKVSEEFVVILMQDDLLHKNHIEKFLGIANAHRDVDVFWGSEDTIDINGKKIAIGLRSAEIELIPSSVNGVRSAMERGCIWTISGSFTRARYLRKKGFREDLPHASDWRFILYALKETNVIYVKDALVTIRIHAGQTTNKHARSLKDLTDYLAVVSEIAEKMPLAIGFLEKKKALRRLRVLALRRSIRAIARLDFKLAGKALFFSLFRLN